MPIRNLTERAQMPRLGKVHLGVKVDGQRGQYPKAVDHFVCPPAVTDALRGKVPFCEGECKEAPGPVELPIVFLTEDEEMVASQWYRAYKSTVGLVCKGDGYKAGALLDREALAARQGDVTPPLPVSLWAGSKSANVVRAEVPCAGEGFDDAAPCPMYETKGCRKLMMLQFAIPDAPGAVGVYQLDTSSVYSIRAVNGTLGMLRTLTGGRISGIPMTLKVVRQDVAPEGKKKTVHVLSLEAPFSLAQLAAVVSKPPMAALLPPPEEEPAYLFPDGGGPSGEGGEPEVAEIVEPESVVLPGKDDDDGEPVTEELQAFWHVAFAELGVPRERVWQLMGRGNMKGVTRGELRRGIELMRASGWR